jgi:hypothetical protein
MPKRLFFPMFTSSRHAQKQSIGAVIGVTLTKLLSPVSPIAVILYERDLLAGTLKGYKSRRPLTVADAKRELCGFDLVCSGCTEDGLPCHGDVLLRYANA